LKKRREEPRPLPSFPFYPRCSSPVGGARLLKTRLLHTPHRLIGHPNPTPQPLAPVPGGGRNARRRTDGSNRFRRPEAPDGCRNSVFPVYAGSPPGWALGIKRAPRRGYAPAVSDRTKPEWTQRFALSVLRLFRRSRSDQPSPVSSLQGGSHV
jgi:hypothetical protein